MGTNAKKDFISPAIGWTFGIVAVVMFVYGIGHLLDLDKSSWPAWVQAIGSIGAILVAVWVSIDQQKKIANRNAQQEHVEITRILQSLYDEIDVTVTGFSRMVDAISGTQAGAVAARFSISDRPFNIYTANADRIGAIPDDKLRKRIILTYARFETLMLVLKINNAYFHEYRAARTQSLTNPANQFYTSEFAAADRVLNEFGHAVRDQYGECETTAAQTLDALELVIANRT